MRTDLEHEVTVTKNIDLRGRISVALVEHRINNNGLVTKAYAEEQGQLSKQTGYIKFTNVFERDPRYNFGLRSVYFNNELVRQLLLSIEKEGGIRTYRITRGEQFGERLFKYEGILTRERATYLGVSQDDGIAEVLFGERRVSHQPHEWIPI